MYWCTASRSSRARSVEITNWPRAHSRGSSCIRSASRAARGRLANAIHLGRAESTLGQQFGSESLRLGNSLHLDGDGVEDAAFSERRDSRSAALPRSMRSPAGDGR